MILKALSLLIKIGECHNTSAALEHAIPWGRRHASNNLSPRSGRRENSPALKCWVNETNLFLSP
jgi:hypothetical protein